MSISHRFIIGLALVVCIASSVSAAGGTATIAIKGQKVSERESWPGGVVELLNHETRGSGWNDWFSEWPNDVDHFEFQVTSMDQVNDVIREFAKIRVERDRTGSDGKPLSQKPVLPEIHLCPRSSPRGFGWVSKFPQDRKIPMIFALGDQAQLDQWYESFIKPNGGKFGVMKFEEVPVAVPPTLTLFVGEPVFDLEKLEIPAGVRVVEGGLPGRWHSAKMATPIGKKAQEGSNNEPAPKKELSAAEKQRRTWKEAVQRFIQRRAQETEDIE